MFHFGIIPGDGAGKIRTRCALAVLEKAARKCQFTYQLDTFDLGADNYIETGELITDSQIASLGAMDGIFLGGFGDPRLERSVCEKGIKVRLWRELNLFVTLRGCIVWKPDICPLRFANNREVDLVIIRENTETSYTDLGSFMHKNTPDELALSQGVFVRKTVEQVMRFAFLAAHHRPRRKLTLVDRSQIVPAHDLVRRVFAEVGREYPDVTTNSLYAYEASSALIVHPEQFDVVITTADIGDMLMSMGVELQGGAGFGATAYINPGQISIHEPCQDWNDDWDNTRSTNPIGAFLAISQMLFNAGQHEASSIVKDAIRKVVNSQPELFNSGIFDADAITKLVVLSMGT